jgi:hypothetical protein
MVSAVSSSGMTSGQIALQILRGSSARAVEPVSAIGPLHKPTVVSKADTAIATIMRIIVDSQGTTISGANDRSSVGFGDGWDIGVEAIHATGQGSVSAAGATATGPGTVTLTSVHIGATLEGQYGSTNTLTTAQARHAVSLDSDGVQASGAGIGNIAIHVDQHQFSDSRDADAAYNFTDIFGDAQGDLAMSVSAFPMDASQMRVYSGDGNDSLSIAAGRIAGVYAGAGNDAIAVTSLSQRDDAIDLVDGGDGDDAISISSSGGVRATQAGVGNDAIAIAALRDVWVVEAGSGDDAVAIATGGSASDVDGGEGDDTISISARGGIENIDGGSGDDVIAVKSLGTVWGVYGGSGDDIIRVSGARVDRVYGGKGDDLIAIDSTAGNASTVYFAEGDGHDVVETNGPLDIRRVSDDGTRTSDMSSAAVTRNDDGTATIRFEGSNDTITVRFTGKMANSEIVVEQDRGRLIIREAGKPLSGPQYQF